jgi:polyhydroxyalkanoate synthesis regulator phasin
MIELIKKTLLTGVGFALLTKEKAEEMAKELADQAKFSEQEGREFVDSLMQQSEKARGDLQAKIEDAVHATLKKLNLATRAEVDSLKAELEALKAKPADVASDPNPVM